MIDVITQYTTLDWAISAAATYIGKRNTNEDRLLLQPWPDHSALLAVVADGMGGHRGGAIAAQIAIDTFAELLLHPLPRDQKKIYDMLAQYFHLADERIREQASQSFKLVDMGTTLVAAIITPTFYVYLHAGDCRFYHFHNTGRLVRRSKDHSIIEVLLDQGKITEEQAAIHPLRSVVNSCLGGSCTTPFSLDPAWQDSDPPIYFFSPGDTLLLCSDGLHSSIAYQKLAQLIEQNAHHPEKLLADSIQITSNISGQDNISGIAIYAY